MELAKSGNIGKLCVPNALATFKEYAIDFASKETKEAAEKFIKNEIENLDGATKRKTEEMIQKVDNGERDVFF
jgi:2-iminoacetate synthase